MGKGWLEVKEGKAGEVEGKARNRLVYKGACWEKCYYTGNVVQKGTRVLPEDPAGTAN